MFCNVIVTRPFNQVFTYKFKKEQPVKIGSLVNVPFGKSNNQIGMVENIFDKIILNTDYKIKNINRVYETITFSKDIIKFINWISDYTLSPKGLVLKLFIINEKNIDYSTNIEKETLFSPDSVKLNVDQRKAAILIKKFLFKESLPIVLEGVTGSGKTEVFFEAIEIVIQKKQQALIMVPEIALTPQLEKRFLKRFGFLPNIWHSKISEKKRRNIWHKSYLGDAMIVVGARSSLFLPFKKLGLIVVDEEHDSSYKQEDNIRYQARDLAIVRAKIDCALIVLSSATPSLETQNNIFKKNLSMFIYLLNFQEQLFLQLN